MMMRRFAAALLALAVAACTSTQSVNKVPPPPQTEVRAVTETIQGVQITDPYRWLEDQNSPETRAWIDRQNAYTDSVLSTLPDKQRFAQRIESLLSTDQLSTPVVRNGRYFFTKRAVGQDLFAIYMRDRTDGPDILLIDPAPMSPKHTTNVGLSDVSEDGKMLAYFVRQRGADEVEMRFFDVDGRHDTGAVLPRARYFGVSITPDRNTTYFARILAEGPRVFRRPINGGLDEKVFGDGYGPEKIITSNLSDDGRYLVIEVLLRFGGEEDRDLFEGPDQ